MNELVLEKAGLTKNESITYLTLLSAGTLKAGDILKKSGLNSGKIYEILESLKNKGLVSESHTNNIRFFTASPPKQILEFLEKQEIELASRKELIKMELPRLEKTRKEFVNETKAFTYIGMKGLRTAANEALDAMRPGEEILTMGTVSKKDPEINKYWIQFGARRIAKRIPNRLIFSDPGPHFMNTRNQPLVKVRYLPSITPATVDVFGGDKIIIFNYEKPITSILIYDKNIAQSFRQFFEQLWKQAKPK